MRGPVDRHRLAFAASFGVVLAAGAARADDAIEPHHLTYRASGEGCPDEAAFRRDVALRLGVDPFLPADRPAPRAMTVTVDGARRATVTLTDGAGKPLGRRDIPGPRASCAEIVADAAFAASVAIDPTVLARPTPAAAPPPAPQAPPPPASGQEPPRPASPQEPAPAHEPAPSAPPAPPDALEAAVRAGGLAAFGLAPAGGFGLSAGLEVKRTWLSASLGGALVLPPDAKVEIEDAATRRPTSATLSTTVFAGDLSGCAHLPPAALQPYGCLTLLVGQLRGAASDIARPKEAESIFVAAGPRVGVTMPASQKLHVDAHVDVPFALTRTELRIDDRAAWSSPTVAAVLSLGIRYGLH